MRVVFDLDGTLANNDHRQHFLERDPKDWDGFFEACGEDEPIMPAIHTFVALYEGCDRRGHRNSIEIWSGRGEGEGGSVREKTLKWLQKHTFGAITCLHTHPLAFFRHSAVALRMRAHGDYTPDEELKRRWLEEAREQYVPSHPQLVFDDRQKVVDMWRAEGIPCFQVAAAGDF